MPYWLIVESPENWEHDYQNNFQYFGLPTRKRNIVTQVVAGDLLVTYVTKVGCFADVRQVTSDKLLWLNGNIGYDTPFNIAIRTRPLSTPDRDRWLEARKVVGKLAITQDLGDKWVLAFRQSIRRLSEKDGKLLTRLLEEPS